ncbi:hypothetical protein B0H14DRAFT_3163601 [Mycena olivaceomarginata]|nr:hypothetical protein B0H14DRAFT_3163601 [Mycena olivaceomarginata]
MVNTGPFCSSCWNLRRGSGPPDPTPYPSPTRTRGFSKALTRGLAGRVQTRTPWGSGFSGFGSESGPPDPTPVPVSDPYPWPSTALRSTFNLSVPRRKREVEERSAYVTLDLHCRRRPIGEGGHCSGTAPKEWDGLITQDSPSKSGPRTAFNVELSRRVSREKLELALKGEVQAAKELQRLAETSALPSPAVKQANNFALQRARLTVKQ